MKTRTLMHISDLHIGRDAPTNVAARSLCRSIVALDVDLVLLTGDVTHRGRCLELAAYEQAFAPLLDRGRLVVVPGNHDRLGDDAARSLMPGGRVQVQVSRGAYVVRVDSTGPQNRFLLAGHGTLTERDVDDIEHALGRAPPSLLRVLCMHHHPLPLPEEGLSERLSTWLGWPYAAELAAGRRLLEGIRGRCDLLLHGHRHVPSEAVLFGSSAPLHVYNAGSSTALGAVRRFVYRGGELLQSGTWTPMGDRGSHHAPITRAPTVRMAQAPTAEIRTPSLDARHGGRRLRQQDRPPLCVPLDRLGSLCAPGPGGRP